MLKTNSNKGLLLSVYNSVKKKHSNDKTESPDYQHPFYYSHTAQVTPVYLAANWSTLSKPPCQSCSWKTPYTSDTLQLAGRVSRMAQPVERRELNSVQLHYDRRQAIQQHVAAAVRVAAKHQRAGAAGCNHAPCPLRTAVQMWRTLAKPASHSHCDKQANTVRYIRQPRKLSA